MTAEATALQRFNAAIDQERWWSTAEIVIPLVQSGLWLELGLVDPYTVDVEVVLGQYAVVQRGHDITRRLDILLGGLKMADVDPDWPAEIPLLGSLAMVDAAYGVTALYKQFGNLLGSELEAIVATGARQVAYLQERQAERVRLADMMRTLGTNRLVDVIADPHPVKVSFIVPRGSRP